VQTELTLCRLFPANIIQWRGGKTSGVIARNARGQPPLRYKGQDVRLSVHTDVKAGLTDETGNEMPQAPKNGPRGPGVIFFKKRDEEGP